MIIEFGGTGFIIAGVCIIEGGVHKIEVNIRIGETP